MHPYLQDVTTDQLAAIFAVNYQAFAVGLGQLPGAVLHQSDDLVWVDTGIPLATFNGVTHTHLAEDDGTLDAAVTRILTHFQARGLPFHWSVGPTTRPADIGTALLAHHLAFDEAEPAMAADLHQITEELPTVPGFTIVPVTTAEHVGQWVQTWGCGAPAAVISSWETVYQGLWRALSPTSFRMYLGLRAGEPVGTVYVFGGGGVAAIHYVVTLPALRRQGIGAALTLHALQEARALGYHIAVLTASPAGIDIYRRLGFREFGTVSTYIWEP